MGKGIAIITDGGSDLGPADAARLGVHVLPVRMVFPDGTETDSNRFSSGDFWERLLADYTNLPKTAQPTPFDFQAEFQRFADDGYDGVIAITMSNGLSGTFDTAVVAAQDAPLPVRVINSRAVSWPLSFLAAELVKAADAGLNLDQLVDFHRVLRESMEIYFVVDTLEYLVRGGRAGRAQAAIATALDIKPILELQHDGVIEVAKKCRGRKKAFAKLATIAAGDAQSARAEGLDEYRYMVLNTDETEPALELERACLDAGFTGQRLGLYQVGIVVGIYCGPGTSAFIYYRLPEYDDFRCTSGSTDAG
ncbi:MAG: DegV family protein [Actinomycetes bacterium]|jgi:DegV family protein with EDD domain|nr:DegV family protein [Actinomycetes bacterium]